MQNTFHVEELLDVLRQMQRIRGLGTSQYPNLSQTELGIGTSEAQLLGAA
jgi:hypothetical protein